MISLSEKFFICDDVVFRKVGGEIVIMHLTNGNYFGLNQVGSRVWELLGAKSPKSLREICSDIAAEFDAPGEQIESDVIALAQDLISNGLIKNEQSARDE